MIRTVATWLCKCGISVKVVVEVDPETPGAAVVATCPGCGDEQLIHASRIVSVTGEKSETLLN
jgi:hypothetical protein